MVVEYILSPYIIPTLPKSNDIFCEHFRPSSSTDIIKFKIFS